MLPPEHQTVCDQNPNGHDKGPQDSRHAHPSLLMSGFLDSQQKHGVYEEEKRLNQGQDTHGLGGNGKENQGEEQVREGDAGIPASSGVSSS